MPNQEPVLAFDSIPKSCPLDPEPLPLNYRHEEETGLYFAAINLRHTPKADVDVCFTP